MRRKRLVIISAGAFGREIFHLARGIRRDDINCFFGIRGFLDDRSDVLTGEDGEPMLKGKTARILSTVEEYEPKAIDVFTCAIGEPAAKRKYAKIIRDKGGVFVNLISPQASILGNGAGLGSGLVVGPFCVISANVTIGNDTCIIEHATVGHDVVMGEGCHVSAFSFIGGGARIGDEVTIHPHACILPGVEVGDGATVGAGSVAARKVPAGKTVFGVPGRIVQT